MERFNRMYQFNPIIDSGGIVNYGSDVVSQFEAARADPFFGMQVGHTRVDPDMPTGVREPASACLRLTDLVQGYTINGAIQLRRAGTRGSIKAGKLADLVVLNKSLFDVPDDEISSVRPVAVLFEGRVVHGSLAVK